MPDTTHGERALWAQVLLAAFQDAARNTARRHRDDRHISYITAAAGRAQHYLTRPSEDLEMVCSLAGVEMQNVIRVAKEQPWYRGKPVVH